MALPEPKDDIERLCLEIAKAMHKEVNPESYQYWDVQPDDNKMPYLIMARVAMNMIGDHLQIQLLEGRNDVGQF